jgi:hypothetical protein
MLRLFELDPIEYHVHGIGEFLLDCVVDDSICSSDVRF